MKKVLIRVGIVAVFLAAAAFIFFNVTKEENREKEVVMEDATLPSVTFTTSGYTVNQLVGYVDEMEMTAMRDTLTPLNQDGSLNINIRDYGADVGAFSYEIYTLDGKTKLKSGKADVQDTITLKLATAMPNVDEAILKIALKFGDDKEAYYYTRIAPAVDYHIKENLDFVKDFQTKAIQKTQTDTLVNYIEPNSEGDNTTLQHVTIHSDLDHVTWGNLTPEIVGDIQWDIKEGTETYSSIQLRYQVKCSDEEGESELYNVREFYRTRNYRDKMYLLDYDRTMNRIFDEEANMLDSQGVDLGMAPENLPYLANEDGTSVSFVQERELWSYDKENDSLYRVFSFADEKREDARSLYDQHKIKLISMKDNGSTAFVVYGYMNRGHHEGKVGAAIYYFDKSKNTVEEEAFIPSNKSFAIAEDDLGKLVYYSDKQNKLYVMIEGNLYRINLEDGGKKILVSGLGQGQYVASEDGDMIAYQTLGSLYEATEVTGMNLSNGDSYKVQAGEGEYIRPLGFVNHDLVCGFAKQGDEGKTVSGTSVVPMYKLEIRDKNNKVAKTYQPENIYVQDILIEENQVTVNRCTKNGALYTAISQDYITNNEEHEENNITLQSYSSDQKEKQMRLKYADGLSNTKPAVKEPKQVILENPATVAFDTTSKKRGYYVYGLGQMLGVYDKAGYAIQEADQVSGVVVSATSQACVWERGNRDLQYIIEDIGEFTLEEGEDSLSACIRKVLEMEGTRTDVKKEREEGKSAVEILSEHSGKETLDLTGCTVEEVLYIISKGTPVIALKDSASAVLLIGYDTKNVAYLDPATGQMEHVTTEKAEELIAGSGKAMIGFVK